MRHRQYRQGDILLVGVERPRIMGDTTKVARDDRGRVVLAYGEATGHAHAFGSRRAVLYRDDGGSGGGGGDQAYLEIQGDLPVPLTHEEHAPIPIEPGWYRVIRQREYTPERVKLVSD